MTTPIQMDPSYPIEGDDISEYQNYNEHYQFTPIDWKAAKETRPSLKFAYVKLGEGTWSGYPLETALEQLTDAQAAGFDTGAYEYDHIEIGAAAQAAYFKKRLPSGLTNLPAWLDIEDECQVAYRHPAKPLTSTEIAQRGPTAYNMAKHIRDSLDAMDQATGQSTVGYTGDWYIGWILYLASLQGLDMGWVKRRKWAIASYTAPWMYIPYLVEPEDVIFWQHTSSPTPAQQVNGFPWKARLDMDYWIRSQEEYAAFAGVKPAPVERTIEQRVTRLEGAVFPGEVRP